MAAITGSSRAWLHHPCNRFVRAVCQCSAVRRPTPALMTALSAYPGMRGAAADQRDVRRGRSRVMRWMMAHKVITANGARAAVRQRGPRMVRQGGGARAGDRRHPPGLPGAPSFRSRRPCGVSCIASPCGILAHAWRTDDAGAAVGRVALGGVGRRGCVQRSAHANGHRAAHTLVLPPASRDSDLTCGSLRRAHGASERPSRASFRDRLGADAQQRVVERAALDAGKAQIAPAALPPMDGALTPAQTWRLAEAVVRESHAGAALIESRAASWMRLAADGQCRVIAAAARDPPAAPRAPAALAVIDGALTAAHALILADAIACDPDRSAHTITRIALHWRRLNAAAQDALVVSAAQGAYTAWRALTGLLPVCPRPCHPSSPWSSEPPHVAERADDGGGTDGDAMMHAHAPTLAASGARADGGAGADLTAAGSLRCRHAGSLDRHSSAGCRYGADSARGAALHR